VASPVSPLRLHGLDSPAARIEGHCARLDLNSCPGKCGIDLAARRTGFPPPQARKCLPESLGEMLLTLLFEMVVIALFVVVIVMPIIIIGLVVHWLLTRKRDKNPADPEGCS
jgi:hypothetical protein